ncbi:MAG: ribosome biogenesis GTP-binding protein YihA/YsxC [Acidimicrobiales bacterium]
MAGPLPLRFRCSAAKAAQLPAAGAELALTGRSNVGKSSLLNALANRRDLARVSKTPGATRLLNVFELEGAPGRWVVDLPGYGFAKVSANERARWRGMIEGYLVDRVTLRRVLVLIDGEVGPTPLDRQMLDWLAHLGRPYTVVATKADKVRSSRRLAQRKAVAERLGLGRDELRWVSAATGAGIPELRAELGRLLAEPAEPAPPAAPLPAG